MINYTINETIFRPTKACLSYCAENVSAFSLEMHYTKMYLLYAGLVCLMIRYFLFQYSENAIKNLGFIKNEEHLIKILNTLDITTFFFIGCFMYLATKETIPNVKLR